jgi:sugar-specific transcriptional regulator TrmB
MNTNLHAWLVSVGLDDQRASIYLAALSRGEASASDLAKDLKMTRTTMYDNLRFLEERKFVRIVRKGKRKIFIPIQPKELMTRLDQQRDRLKDLLPDFLALASGTTSTSFAQSFSGPYAAREVFEDILKYAKDEYVYFSAPGETVRMVDRRFMEAWVKRRVAKRIKRRSLRVKTKTVQANTAIFYEEKSYLRQIKYFPLYVDFRCSIYIYEQRIGIISTNKEGVAYIINSVDLAFSLRQLFEFLWGISMRASE